MRRFHWVTRLAPGCSTGARATATRAAVAPSARAVIGRERTRAGERLPIDPVEQAHGQVGVSDPHRFDRAALDGEADGGRREAGVAHRGRRGILSLELRHREGGVRELEDRPRLAGRDQEVAVLMTAELGDVAGEPEDIGGDSRGVVHGDGRPGERRLGEEVGVRHRLRA